MKTPNKRIVISLISLLFLSYQQTSYSYWVNGFWIPDDDYYFTENMYAPPLAVAYPPLYPAYSSGYYYNANPYPYYYSGALIGGFLGGLAVGSMWNNGFNSWGGGYNNTYNYTAPANNTTVNNTTNNTTNNSATKNNVNNAKTNAEKNPAMQNKMNNAKNNVEHDNQKNEAHQSLAEPHRASQQRMMQNYNDRRMRPDDRQFNRSMGGFRGGFHGGRR